MYIFTDLNFTFEYCRLLLFNKVSKSFKIININDPTLYNVQSHKTSRYIPNLPNVNDHPLLNDLIPIVKCLRTKPDSSILAE